MKKILTILIAMVFLFSCVQVFSQMSGLSISLPVPTPPRITNVSDNSLSTPPDQQVTVTAKIITYAPLHIDTATSPPTLTWQTQSLLNGSPKLWYTTNYADALPTWLPVNMDITNTEDRSNIDHTMVYTVRAQIPGQPASTIVYYGIECKDTYTNTEEPNNGGQGNNYAVEKIKCNKSTGPGWAGAWNNALTILVGETPPGNEQWRYKDAYQQSNIQLPNELDILEMRVASGKDAGKDTLFFKIGVEGQFDQGTTNLSGANALVVAVLTLRRPISTSATQTGKIEGTYALINLPNATQPPVNNIITSNPSINCVECAVGGAANYGFIGTSSDPKVWGDPPLPTGTGSQYLQFKVPFTNLTHHPQRNADALIGPDGKGYNLYDPAAYACVSASAIVNAIDLSNISFSICDLTNGFTYYNRNKTYKVQTPVTYTVSGTVYTVIGSGSPPDANTVKSALSCVNAMQEPVTINPTVVNPEQVVYQNLPLSQYPKKYKYTYSVSIVSGEYILKLRPTNYLPAELSFTLSANLTGQDMSFYQPLAGGDLDGSGKVDATDLNILVNNFGKEGQTINQGDLSGDSKVGLKDFGIMVKNWGKEY